MSLERRQVTNDSAILLETSLNCNVVTMHASHLHQYTVLQDILFSQVFSLLFLNARHNITLIDVFVANALLILIVIVFFIVITCSYCYFTVLFIMATQHDIAIAVS